MLFEFKDFDSDGKNRCYNNFVKNEILIRANKMILIEKI